MCGCERGRERERVRERERDRERERERERDTRGLKRFADLIPVPKKVKPLHLNVLDETIFFKLF